jgi:putative transcriptional regulator
MESLKGYLLIATPQLLDPNFGRTVLLIFDHTDEGAAGVVLNRPTEMTVTEISEQVFQERLEWSKAIHLGGPVPGPLIAIHTVESLGDDEIFAGLHRTVDPAKIEEVVRRNAEPSLIVANYAGWGPGQLEREIRENSWLFLPATAEHVFWPGESDLWDTVVKKVSASQLTRILGIREIPSDPNLN